jgi:hypothetical protein
MLLALLTACRDDVHPNRHQQTPGGPGPVLSVDDAHRWTWEEQVHPGMHTLPPGDACFDWSAVTKNARGEAYVHDKYDQLRLIEWDAPIDAVVDGRVNADDVRESWPVTIQRNRTMCLDDSIFLHPFEAGSVWQFSLSHLGRGGVGEITGALIEVQEGAPEGPLVLTNDSVDYAFVATLGAAVEAPPGRPDVTVDWSDVVVAGDGMNEYWSGNQTTLVAARFDVPSSTDLPSVLDAHLAQAAEWYEVDIDDARTAALTDATSADGEPFRGFGTDGVWVVAVTCEDCWFVPPPILAVVDVARR